MFDTLEKGGKRAQIGEQRVWGGVTYVKHADGWVFLKKDGSHHVEGPDGKRRPGEQQHLDHYKKHNLTKEVEDDGGFKKEAKEKAPLTRRVGKELALQHNTKEDADKLKSMTRHLMKITKDVSKEVVESAEKRFKEKGLDFSPEDKVYYRIGTTYDIMSAISRYCKDTDKITGWGLETEGDRIVMSLNIERDGVQHHIENNLVEAGGHNIQQWHTRMMTSSDLPPNSQEEQGSIKDQLSGDLEGHEKSVLQDKLDILESSYKDSRELLRLKREPLRAVAVAEKGEKFIKELDKLKGDTDDEFLTNLLEHYSNNKVLFSNFDQRIKESVKKVFSPGTGLQTKEKREFLDTLKNRVKETPMKGDDSQEGQILNSLKHFGENSKEGKKLLELLTQGFKGASHTPFGKSLKEVFETESHKTLENYHKMSKSQGNKSEMEKILKSSYLPANLGSYILPKGTKYNKETKTLSISGEEAKAVEGKGNNLLTDLSGGKGKLQGGEAVNFYNKSLNIVNPTTGKAEEFKFKGQKSGNLLVFESKSGLKLELKTKNDSGAKYQKLKSEGDDLKK